ncbi:hypothetical protein [uncultured Roseobacter sp.]|uniref:hypothetical protein n=1 Tax=uncultured Roseobacter sp. TaxID=114847 RepID=UPI00262E1444|nr:hypothetical protein [uncultured Roseobacter sp.]
MADQWSEWFEHDGLPNLALIGCYVRCQAFDGRSEEGIVEPQVMQPPENYHSAWVYHQKKILREYLGSRVVRYQIRRPRGMALLDRALRVDVPELAS